MPASEAANPVPSPASTAADHAARIAAIRDEMRFELNIFHDRINALISAEAFLLISFTMALNYAGRHPSTPLSWIGPVLAAVGFVLAGLSWPAAATSHRIIVEWNILFMEALDAGHAAATLRWRPSVFLHGNRRVQADHRRGMLFPRFVPPIFMVAWLVLAGILLLAR